MADPLIRFYHYLSEEKVTEAVEQIPADLLERLKVELKLPLVSVGNTGAGARAAGAARAGTPPRLAAAPESLRRRHRAL